MKYLATIIVLTVLVSLMWSDFAIAEAPNDVVAQLILDTYGLDTNDYQIEITSNSLKTTDVAYTELTFRPLSQKEPLGLYTILAEVTKNGKVVETGQVRMNIRKFADVVVVNDRFKRSESFSTDRLYVTRKDVTTLREQPLLSLDEAIGFRAKRNLQKEAILTKQALEQIPDLEVGMETKIVYNDGLCLITAPGVALQSGVHGDFIRVKNKATNKIIVARVSDDGAVTVGP